MKKLGIFIIILFVFVTGMAVADPGVPKVNEVQGLALSTTLIAAGNFNSASSVDLTISSRAPITGIPGPLWIADEYYGGAIYQSVYTEDTQNAEVGYISYDKDLDLSTGNKVTGQYNIGAVKQITYLGVDASSVISNDFMMVDGAGISDYVAGYVICPFADAQGNTFPTFCNRVETGNNMNLKVANLNTAMGDRFIMKSADPGVEINQLVGVTSYAADLPSKGSASAYIRGSIREGGRLSDHETSNDTIWAEDRLYETVTFSDSTAVSGDITTFNKVMRYSSIIDTSGDHLPVVMEG
jgi:hypothetical protein